ncbi:cytochrome c4 [Legionella quinlivanii]|uniref:Cytochrome c4 n=1 Tax=Legionella quinlivanii TaxID=45073 RepID=A0A0W0Y476_9GAMM|nr:c-type cytochrome [Legionella quinlivanii]KTD51820.1 cytochrome c4 [Legionella quinlivanii]SEF82011.1 Cytochrome c553 [Legionella quinlivanii DSM 21216]STY09719.1 cytochrome c4 [Legionella quinlivanii]
MKKIILAAMLLAFSTGFAAPESEASQNRPEKISLCSACHGENGSSNNPLWPNLGGQHADYLLKQLQDYKAGKTRADASMTGIAATLTPQDMELLSAYYAKQPVALGKVPKRYVKRGEELYRGGDFDKHITACIACHGPRGTGNGQAGFPLLSGQHAAYTIAQLQAFKNKKRSNDINHIMQDISKRMSDEDMEAVAYYIQGLH